MSTELDGRIGGNPGAGSDGSAEALIDVLACEKKPATSECAVA